MFRSLVASGAVGVLVSLSLSSPAVSIAAPFDDEPECVFDIAPPKVVAVSGVNMVEASIKSRKCTIDGSPGSVVVCMSIDGDDSAGQCASGGFIAELYYPYRAGATYVTKGQGCALIPQPPYRLCQDIPASRVTL